MTHMRLSDVHPYGSHQVETSRDISVKWETWLPLGCRGLCLLLVSLHNFWGVRGQANHQHVCSNHQHVCVCVFLPFPRKHDLFPFAIMLHLLTK